MIREARTRGSGPRVLGSWIARSVQTLALVLYHQSTTPTLEYDFRVFTHHLEEALDPWRQSRGS